MIQTSFTLSPCCTGRHFLPGLEAVVSRTKDTQRHELGFRHVIVVSTAKTHTVAVFKRAE